MPVPHSEALRQRIEQAISDSRHCFEKLPGVVVVNAIEDGRVLYICEKGQQLLGTTLSELQAMGTEYHERFFNPELAAEYVPLVLDVVSRNDPSETITFFQQVRYAGIAEWQWHLTALRVFVQDDEGKAVALLSVAQHLAPEHHYTRKIDRLIEELDFIKTHVKSFETLGRREREVLRLMAQGRSTQEIGDALHISALTAETHRRNVRRKLGVQRHSDIAQFARAFDLV